MKERNTDSRDVRWNKREGRWTEIKDKQDRAIKQ